MSWKEEDEYIDAESASTSDEVKEGKSPSFPPPVAVRAVAACVRSTCTTVVEQCFQPKRGISHAVKSGKAADSHVRSK